MSNQTPPHTSAPTLKQSRIEDYALIGNCRSAALVSREGSIDWLCLPRFDSPACFAALLGGEDFGHWQISPREKFEVTRRYRQDSLVLETEFRTATGCVLLTDAMIMDSPQPLIVRTVCGLEGVVDMRTQIVLRFDYGSLVPWVRALPGGGIDAVAGPDHVRIRTEVPLHGEDLKTVGDFTMRAGHTEHFTFMWSPSHLEDMADVAYPAEKIGRTHRFWTDWAQHCTYRGEYREAVVRSLITLKALTYEPTGGIVAAVTTSLPECLGGVRNWDYRYCWLRDATFTLYAFLSSGYRKEAEDWRQWLVRSVAGTPEQISIMYGVEGNRRLTEEDLAWLPGYENSRPVRVGNAAHDQLQLDVFGEIFDAMHLARKVGAPELRTAWSLQQRLLVHIEKIWREPDEGIWEVRGPRQHFVYSKVMIWVAVDRAVQAIENYGLPGDAQHLRALRDEIHADVCEKGYNAELGIFTQAYGSRDLDASLLLLPVVGFIEPKDPRNVRTVEAIQRELMSEGFVSRYDTHSTKDGLPPGEGAFLACTFWLADNLVLQGRHLEARALFERLLTLQSDVGLLAEEYSPELTRQLGNFPQALSHIALVNTARNLSALGGDGGGAPGAGGDGSSSPAESPAQDRRHSAG